MRWRHPDVEHPDDSLRECGRDAIGTRIVCVVRGIEGQQPRRIVTAELTGWFDEPYDEWAVNTQVIQRGEWYSAESPGGWLWDLSVIVWCFEEELLQELK